MSLQVFSLLLVYLLHVFNSQTSVARMGSYFLLKELPLWTGISRRQGTYAWVPKPRYLGPAANSLHFKIPRRQGT